MQMSGSLRATEGLEGLTVLNEALLDEMERIHEPALFYLPGGRIAAVNRAAARLSEIPVVGMSIHDLLARHEARRADGSLLIRSDLSCARALRGEIVAQGERSEMNLSNWGIYRALGSSTPVIVNGEVAAALSIWHDFDAYIRELASSTKLLHVSRDGGADSPDVLNEGASQQQPRR